MQYKTQKPFTISRAYNTIRETCIHNKTVLLLFFLMIVLSNMNKSQGVKSKKEPLLNNDLANNTNTKANTPIMHQANTALSNINPLSNNPTTINTELKTKHPKPENITLIDNPILPVNTEFSIRCFYTILENEEIYEIINNTNDQTQDKEKDADDTIINALHSGLYTKSNKPGPLVQYIEDVRSSKGKNIATKSNEFNIDKFKIIINKEAVLEVALDLAPFHGAIIPLSISLT